MEILSKFNKLPENLQQEVLNYIEFLVKTNLHTETQIPVKKLDPFTHSVPIEYQTEEDLTNIKPFVNVKNSAKYGKELRKRAWDRK
ncbi:MAG: DUF2281 domain-containing protein [Candidatus Marithrix sp.]